MSGKKGPYVGVDVGGTKILALVVNGDGEVLGRHKEPTRQNGTPLADQIVAAVDGALNNAALKAKDLAAIGLAVPGVVDSRTGRFVTAPNLVIDDPEVAKRVQERLGIPVAIGNDVNLGTLAEVWLGAGRGFRTVVGVFPGTGIGGGVIVDGRLQTGPEDLGGEVGHMILLVDGPRCGCGSLGCWEALASRKAIEREIHDALARGRHSIISAAAAEGSIKSGALREALEAGDDLVTEIMKRTGHYLAQGILSIRHLLDPELIILGGGLIEACGDFLLPLIEAEVRADKMKGSRDEMKIAVSKLGDDAVALGAAALAAQGDDAHGSVPNLPEDRPLTYPTIENVRFGVAVVDGKELAYDFYLRADGKLGKRKKKPVRAKYGTSHVVDREELEKVCKGEPRVVLIGSGHHDMVRLTDDARHYLDSLGVSWQILPTPEAAQAYNEAGGPKALLMHVTC